MAVENLLASVGLRVGTLYGCSEQLWHWVVGIKVRSVAARFLNVKSQKIILNR